MCKLWNPEPGSPPTLNTLLWPGWLLSYTHSFNFTQFHLGQLFFSILWIPPIEAKNRHKQYVKHTDWRIKHHWIGWVLNEVVLQSLHQRNQWKKIKLCIPVKNTIYSACGWKYSQMMAQQGCHFGALCKKKEWGCHQLK